MAASCQYSLHRSKTYLGEHLLGSESLDVSNCTRSSLLELDAVEHLVDVQGVVAAGGLHFSLSHLIVN